MAGPGPSRHIAKIQTFLNALKVEFAKKSKALAGKTWDDWMDVAVKDALASFCTENPDEEVEVWDLCLTVARNQYELTGMFESLVLAITYLICFFTFLPFVDHLLSTTRLVTLNILIPTTVSRLLLVAPRSLSVLTGV